MKHIKSYEHLDVDVGFNLTNVIEELPQKYPNEYQKFLEIAKKGKLYKYLSSGKKQLTFGILKSIHQDAIRFKRDRESKQAVEKFLIRAIPLALAPFFFPIWVASVFLGSSRALNKVLEQSLKIDDKNYDSFLWSIVKKMTSSKFINAMILASEGDIEKLYADDWFYRSFAIEKGLLEMSRKEHIIEFGYYITKKMQEQDDLAPVPPYYMENEFRIFLNTKFRLNPKLPLKSVKTSKISKKNLYYEG